jgi:hypothetical protein
MNKEPKKIKLTDTPSCKEPNRIPLPPLHPNKYDVDMMDDIYRPDRDSVYIPIKNEDSQQNNS